MKLVLVCDGGYKKFPGRPGVATYGWVARQTGRTLKQESGVVSSARRAHNFMAEYGAIVSALQWVLAAKLDRLEAVEVWSDCEYVVDQLNRAGKPGRIRGLTMLHMTALRYAEQLRRRGCHVEVRHVNRRQVSTAHRLCRLVYNRSQTPGLSVKLFLRRGRGREA